MAPTVPKKRPSIRARTAKPSTTSSATPTHLPNKHRENAIISDQFISSKRDKRTIKSNSFLTRIEKGAPKKALKRRRPNKKLVANLESLVDALPDLDDEEGGKVAGGMGGVGGEGKVVMRSLTSGKGLQKRRKKEEGRERERFGKNMAELMGAQATAVSGGEVAKSSESGAEVQKSSTASRFAALRNWIGATMEKEKAFEGKD